MIIKWGEAVGHPGGLTKITLVVKGDRPKITQLVADAARHPDQYQVEICKVKKQRGLNANSYYWKLVDKMAAVLGTTKQEVHTQLLTDYGTFKTDESGEIVTLMLKQGTDPTDFADYPAFLSSYGVGTENYSVYGICKGSSEMDSTEFSKLLDGAISECKELGIEVLSDMEIKRMCELLER